MSCLFSSDGQSTGGSALASVLPMNIQGWFPLGLTDMITLLFKGLTLQSLLQHHNSKASVLLHSAFFMVQLSLPHTITQLLWAPCFSPREAFSHLPSLQRASWQIPPSPPGLCSNITFSLKPSLITRLQAQLCSLPFLGRHVSCSFPTSHPTFFMELMNMRSCVSYLLIVFLLLSQGGVFLCFVHCNNPSIQNHTELSMYSINTCWINKLIISATFFFRCVDFFNYFLDLKYFSGP